MSQINKPPFGLQDFLGSKNFGKNPRNLLLDVRPTIDLFPFLGYEQINTARADGEVNGRGQTGVLEIPNGELWIPITLGGSLIATTGGEHAASLQLLGLPGLTPGQNINLAVSQTVFTAVVGDIIRVAWNPPWPVVFGGGTQFSLDADKNPGTGTLGSVEMAYYELTV